MVALPFSLERAIPSEVALGVISGQYSVHGGVIRDAGGQIVRHLVSSSTSILNPLGIVDTAFAVTNTLQLRNLTAMTEQLIQLSQATMALAGLNLAVSAAGFAMMQRSLAKLDQRIKVLEAKVNWIQAFLDSERRSVILHAAGELSALPSQESHRERILHQCRENLGRVTMHYLSHWDESSDLLEAMSHQHYFCAASLMMARCSAELGMSDKALLEIENSKSEWQKRARVLAAEKIIGEQPQRLMKSQYAELAPIAKIGDWMDFAFDEQKGYGWVDELREGAAEPGLFSRVFTAKMDEADRSALGYLDNLSHRNRVLEGYASQYRYLHENGLTPSGFDEHVKALREQEGASEDDLLILAPASAQ